VKKLITIIITIYIIWIISSLIDITFGLHSVIFIGLLLIMLVSLILIVVNRLFNLRLLKKNTKPLGKVLKVSALSIILILSTMFLQYKMTLTRADIVLNSIQTYYLKNNKLPLTLDSLDCNIKTGYGFAENFIYEPRRDTNLFYFGNKTHFGIRTKGLYADNVKEYFYND